jgi:hypothetical protein
MNPRMFVISSVVICMPFAFVIRCMPVGAKTQNRPICQVLGKPSGRRQHDAASPQQQDGDYG